MQLFIVARKKLNYRFHNLNTAEITADYILKVFMEVNEKKVERAMQEAAENDLGDKEGEIFSVMCNEHGIE